MPKEWTNVLSIVFVMIDQSASHDGEDVIFYWDLNGCIGIVQIFQSYILLKYVL